MKRVVFTVAMVVLGVLAAFGVALVCTVAFFALGGIFYSFSLGVVYAPVITVPFAICRFVWWRDTTSWPLVVSMVVTQIVMSVLAIMDSPRVATMLWTG